jgi:hypothetical protein
MWLIVAHLPFLENKLAIRDLITKWRQTKTDASNLETSAYLLTILAGVKVPEYNLYTRREY